MSDATRPPAKGAPSSDQGTGPDLPRIEVADAHRRYWKTNLLIMRVLLLIWAVAGLGCGVILADWLNQFSLGGLPLGFWFAQQGSIIIFVLLILVYALVMNRADRRHRDDLARLRRRNELEP